MKAKTEIILKKHISDEGKYYSLIRQIGEGKQSKVFEAMDKFGKKVCIKIEPEDSCEQLKNEIMILPKLEGCIGVPRLLDCGKALFWGKKWCGVVTDVIGIPLSNLHSKWNESDLIDIAKKAISTLKSIHSRGIIHNDIKPDHIIIGKNESLY